MAKPASSFPEIVYINIILSYVSASTVTVLWIIWTCDCCFFHWFPRGKSAACKKYQIKLLKKVWCILLVLRTWFNSFAIQFEAHQDNLNINVWKRTEAGAMKMESSGTGATLKKTKSSRVGAVSLLRRLRRPGNKCTVCRILGVRYELWKFGVHLIKIS